ncbi:MAG TPA: tetratricopeptide repeat protein [Pyrinomonadaceae bacterium]
MLTIFLVSIRKGFPHMNLTDERLRQLDNPSLTDSERVLLRCRLAAEFIHIGQYQAAREALGELWRGAGVRPNIEGLEKKVAAEVLLQCGALSGWIGSSMPTKGVQENAKDLISESISIFESIGASVRAALARSDLALCYWREGAYDEARIILGKAVDALTETDTEQKATILLRCVTVECAAGKYNAALDILKDAARLLNESRNDVLKGSLHNLYAVTLQRMGSLEGHTDYYDQAIIEYTAAVHHYKQARHERFAAIIENNLALVLYRVKRYEEAHKYLDRAERALQKLNDDGLLAEVNETRARVYLAEQKYREANRAIARAIQTFEKGSEPTVLTDAFVAQGIAWARLGVFDSSIGILRRAVSIAEEAGAHTNAALAALTLIEEHGAKRLAETEAYNLYLNADSLLKETQNAEIMARLRACARIIILRRSRLWMGEGFTLPDALLDYEAQFIEQALEGEHGIVSRAARRLGINYQTLINILNTRHQNLLTKRTPPKKRGRRIIKKAKD